MLIKINKIITFKSSTINSLSQLGGLSINLLIFAALTREGIYRVPGFRAKLNELKNMYNRGKILIAFFDFVLSTPFP